MKLEIYRTKTNCSSNCPFLDSDWFDSVATCLLFKETLRPIMDYGSVEGWNTCTSCDKVVLNAGYQMDD